MKKPFLSTLALILAFGALNAQTPVSMAQNTNLLNPIIGFNYNDCVVDMNGDHLDDVVRVTDNGMYIDYQQPNGSFTQSFFGINFQSFPSWSMCAGDLDNNGYTDLLFGDGDAVSFVMANATGTAYAEYLMPGYIFSQRSTMSDIDNDGDLDAFVCHDVDQSHPYRNDGNGNMTLDQSLIVTADRPGNYAAIWTDYDNDRDQDLYITKCKGGAQPGDIDRTNLLYQNNGDGTFSEVGAVAGLDDNAQSWSTVFEDFDNDGDFDAFIVNHDFQNRFFLNNGNGTFTDMIGTTGINPNDLGAWENASGDFNNDGWVDILSELQMELYLNKGDLTFTGQNLQVSGGGIGDLNNDGFLDVVSGGSVFLNAGNNNNWLKINTVGNLSNRQGIGSRVELYGAWGMQIREVRSGQSFSPMSSLTTYFGIGEATQIDSVVVRWPSGVKTVIENPAINTTVSIPEASCLLAQTDIMVTGNTTLCPGQTVTLSLPNNFEAVEWSNDATTTSLTVSQPGNYSAVLTDGTGCISFTNTVTVSLAEEVAPTISAVGETKFCEGGSVVLTMSGGTNPVWSTGETSNSITVTTSGEYFVETDAICTTASNSSETITVEVLNSDLPVVTGANIAPGDSVLLTATGEGLVWFDVPTGGTPLYIGNSFQTPILSQTTTYYVESQQIYPGEIQSGGKLDNAGAGGTPTQGSYNLFNAWEPFTLQTVKVYVPATSPAGLRTIRLYNGNGIILQESDFDLSPGEHVLTLNFEVPTGDNLSLRCLQNNLFRNTNSATQFPYPIGTVGEITNDALGNEFYYYFYDWKIQKRSLECISDRVAVSVSVSGSNDVVAEAAITISPNPASESVLIEIAGQSNATNLSVYDATGREVARQAVASNAGTRLSVAGFAPGVYMVKINTEAGFSTAKLVVE